MFKEKLNRGILEKKIEHQDKGIVFAQPLSMRKRILVADDDESIRDILKIILEKAGYEVELIDNGNDILKNNFFTPHLFLIDRLLSGSNGLAICIYLKSHKATKNIPVVIISASTDLCRSSKEAGADDYIEKPFDMKHLLKIIEGHINPSKKSLLEKNNL